MRGSLFIAALALTSPALAHDQWANGGKVPDWVKASCCGPADAHHLRPDQVHDLGDSYKIDGLEREIPKVIGGKVNSQILPSQDSEYWAFYRAHPEHTVGNQYNGQSYLEPASESVYCFFVPMEF